MFEVEFKKWLEDNFSYTSRTVGDIVSRVKRANKILPWYNDVIYQFMLEQQNDYKAINPVVRSQIKGAVKKYNVFMEQREKEEL